MTLYFIFMYNGLYLKKCNLPFHSNNQLKLLIRFCDQNCLETVEAKLRYQLSSCTKIRILTCYIFQLTEWLLPRDNMHWVTFWFIPIVVFFYSKTKHWKRVYIKMYMYNVSQKANISEIVILQMLGEMNLKNKKMIAGFFS